MSIPINPVNGPNAPFKPINNGYGIQPLGPVPNYGGDMHDIFKVDKLGNITNGHTTFRIPNGQQKRISW